jgi:hypothetical protein
MKITYILILFSVLGCSSSIKDTFNSQELTSSKGEKIYINSLNWGMTDDNQMSIVTSDPKRLENRNDTVGVVYGLEPFIYRFENDTLKLFFEDDVTYSVQRVFKTITVTNIVLNRKKYAEITKKAYDNDGYYSVPRRKKVNYPSDMPKPPKL